jgi:hypothetical protein
VGRRSYRNTLTLFRDISSRTNLERIPLIATDGFAFYAKVIRRVFGPACLYGQVIKTRRNDRIVKVERRAIIGADWRLEKVLADSEDSSKLNTSFIERLNLTIRQGSAYLSRRTICHARWKERLEDHLELIRCYYSFVRPHRALKFGREVRTPAMQAGLTTRRLTFREIFSSTMSFLALQNITLVFFDSTMLVNVDDSRVSMAAWQHWMAEAPLWPQTVNELAAAIQGRVPAEHVFVNRYGRPITRFGVYDLVTRYVRRVVRSMPSLATKKVSPHTIRRSTATHLLRGGVDINTVRDWLGHVSVDTTNIYARVDLETKAKAIAHCEPEPTKVAKHWSDDKGLMTFLRSL